MEKPKKISPILIAMKHHNQITENVKTYAVNTKTASRYCHIAAYYPDFVC